MKQRYRSSRRTVLALSLSLAGLTFAGLSTAVQAQSPDEFYKGKTITIYVGYSPGGSYDYYARTFAQFMGKYIPGNPNVIVSNMTGASSLKAANYIYNVAPKDGTALGVVTQTVMLEDAFKTPGVKYKAAEFSYVGRMTAVLETIVSGSPKTKTIEDARKHEVIQGGTGPTSPTEGYARLLNTFAGTKFRIVSGFDGTSGVMLAIERGEIDSTENSYVSIIRSKKPELDSGKLNILVQASLERSKVLPNVPTLIELGTTPEAKAALTFYTSSAAVSRSLLGPPGIPADRLKTLRDAFMKTTKDKEFLAVIAKSHAEFDPESGEYLEDLAKKVAATPPAIIQRTADALKPK
ncbi:MAG TPA: tripartite tricarboxylate transporter substrate-binding protein [Xanthobacteraceae bacterium]|jgi:tripartite-type tricarboxylate transporter receptor subunit TctC|nr:tripartite tricarboxylate transporter substrate-binding protein [Xanthobacteraceae bacterium]